MSIDMPTASETSSADLPGTAPAEVRPETPQADVPDSGQQAIGQTPVKTAETTVLIAETEVLFGTAAATGLRRKDRGWITVLRRIFAGSSSDSLPKRRNPPPRMDFLESSRMAREMLRL
jgi:hypothetical protein